MAQHEMICIMNRDKGTDLRLNSGIGLRERPFLILRQQPRIGYSACGQDGPQEMERNEAAAKHIVWASCAWLQFSFFPFPVGHPVHGHGRMPKKKQAPNPFNSI